MGQRVASAKAVSSGSATAAAGACGYRRPTIQATAEAATAPVADSARSRPGVGSTTRVSGDHRVSAKPSMRATGSEIAASPCRPGRGSSRNGACSTAGSPAATSAVRQGPAVRQRRARGRDDGTSSVRRPTAASSRGSSTSAAGFTLIARPTATAAASGRRRASASAAPAASTPSSTSLATTMPDSRTRVGCTA